MMKDDDFKLLRGFADRQTNERTDGRTDICECRVAFATENIDLRYYKHRQQVMNVNSEQC